MQHIADLAPAAAAEYLAYVLLPLPVGHIHPLANKAGRQNRSASVRMQPRYFRDGERQIGLRFVRGEHGRIFLLQDGKAVAAVDAGREKI